MRSHLLLLVALVVWLAPAVAVAEAPPAASVVAFVDVNVVPLDFVGQLAHQTLLVRDGRIVALARTGTIAIPRGAKIVDGRDRWLIPGLNDMHVHLTSPVELPLYLANGVTTVFNLDGRAAHLRWRDAIAAGRMLGPTIYSSGPLHNSAMTPAEAVRAVDAEADAGYDAVKIYNGVGAAEYPALVAEAKRRGLLLMGHVARGPGYAATVAAGQSIAHMEELTYTFFNPRGDDDFQHIVLDERRIGEAARLAADAGVFVTPTLTMFHAIIRQATDLRAYLEGAPLASLAPWLRAGLEPGANVYDQRYSPADLALLQRSLPFQRRLVRAMADAKVRLLTGTDATFLGPVAGFSLHDELEELVASGLTPFEALRAATVNPAAYFKRRDTAGTIAVGARADLVLLGGDPLARIGNTRAIAGVMAGGVWRDGRELRALVAALPAAYARERERVTAMLEREPAAALAFLDENDPLNRLGAALLLGIAEARGAQAMLEVVRHINDVAPVNAMTNEDALNTLGYALAGAGQVRAALDVLEANVRRFPGSANARDSWGEILARAGDDARAVAAYRDALRVDAHYGNASFARRFIAEHASQ
jgi:imidazolonepropionase-like amidohydrolase